MVWTATTNTQSESSSNAEEDGSDGDAEMDEDDDDMNEPSSSTSIDEFLGGKDDEERMEIQTEMQELLDAVPQLANDYKLISRLGTGTFSSVYKAIDLHYDKWYNRVWHGRHSPKSSAHYQSVEHPRGARVYVALKRIYVTSSPERIRNEIRVMEDSRGCRHVCQLITAFRRQDQVVAVMPYQKNEDFREFFATLPMAGVKEYLRCLLRGLRDTHARGIIHRDLKPANFLYDPCTGKGTICDFGLASVNLDSPSPNPKCLHTAATRSHLHGQLKSHSQYDISYIKRMQREARARNHAPADTIGWPLNDARQPSKANRAGTRGFRAPEVLLKCIDQTAGKFSYVYHSIDIWSVGIMLLLFLTGKFPLFNAGDDIEALMEIATIMGMKRMEKIATLHSRVISTNLPSITPGGMPWREFCSKQNESLEEPPPACPQWFPHAKEPVSQEEHLADLDNAFDLLEKLMHPESVARITARDALYHPFLHEEPGDDHFFPHPFGQGVCGHLHDRDEDGSLVVIREDGSGRRMMRYVESGEGIAIGDEPCEFHADDDSSVQHCEFALS
ncbi:kinase-like domain-containing protein [Mucidula mucida]|nr:kinase-like domain-containing protein [Mucidula mucida]